MNLLTEQLTDLHESYHWHMDTSRHDLSLFNLTLHGKTSWWLPLQGQGNGAFVESVQQAIADQLEIGIADITFQEKKKLIRQYSRGKH